MTLDHRAHHLEDIRAGLSVVLYPFQYAVDLPMRAEYWAEDIFSSRQDLLKELEELRMQQLTLKTEVQKLTAVEAENVRLRELLLSSQRAGQKVVIAEILEVDLDPFSRQVVINKGSGQGVFVGQPILDADGVIGQVVHVGPFSSTAMLITDPNHAIPVHVMRNGLRSIAVGTGDQTRLELPYLANNAEIVEGDLLITSGLGGRFPPGYPVARVTHVEKDLTQSYAKVMATPSAHLERVREVLLVFVDPAPPAIVVPEVAPAPVPPPAPVSPATALPAPVRSPAPTPVEEGD